MVSLFNNIVGIIYDYMNPVTDLFQRNPEFAAQKVLL